ncbi:MAG: class I SAM-dependent methyltransferase [Verrucomicrobiota bacterium]
MDSSRPLPRATELAHSLVRERLREGDTAVDATVGNGHDTLFLAHLVGPAGRVIGFDIQKEAIEATREKTREVTNVSLHHASHERMEDFVATSVKAVLFNLGYLPSADKTITTQPGTTVAALEASLRLLLPGGLITIAVYTGHEGGAVEAETIEEFIRTLPQETYSAALYQFLNQRNSPPHLIAVERKTKPEKA